MVKVMIVVIQINAGSMTGIAADKFNKNEDGCLQPSS